MFELAEIGHKLSKTEYEKQLPALRSALLEAQLDLKKSQAFPVIILIGGVDGAGRGQTVRLLNEWMDARYIETNAMYADTDEEKEHPAMWKFWRTLPQKGKIGIFFGSWYTDPIVSRVFKKIDDNDLNERIDNIIRFEKMLSDEGALILKFWFHLSKKAQISRMKKLKKNDQKKWQMSKKEIKYFKKYDQFRDVSEHTLMRTSTAEAPWIVVDATDTRFKYMTVGKEILTALRERLDDKRKISSKKLPLILPPIDHKTLLSSLDFSQTIEKEEYEKKLLRLQERLRVLVQRSRENKISTTIVFEGMDAAGKGGSIRRIASAIDPREYKIIPIAAPTEEEKLYPYLWRFWRHIPRAGSLTIFDRSWYGRVLVERIEGFCKEEDWQRAYSEIVDFEEQVANNHHVLIKFWLSITKHEQLKRFNKRKETSFKHYKITDEDWRNREKWDQYELAAEEMIARTSTRTAPWVIVEANNKYIAHLKILNNLCKYMERALNKRTR